jgi:hypothetical protein
MITIPKCIRFSFDEAGRSYALYAYDSRNPSLRLVGDAIVTAWPSNVGLVEIGDKFIEGNQTQPRGYLLRPGEPYPIERAALDRWYVAGLLDDGVSVLFAQEIADD